MHNIPCQLGRNFYLGFPKTWMGEVFPSIVCPAPHELVMVATHQFSFEFFSVISLLGENFPANGVL